jgi:hypothetical protein
LVGSINARVEVVLNLLVYEGDDLLAEGLSVALSLHFHVEQLLLKKKGGFVLISIIIYLTNEL